MPFSHQNAKNLTFLTNSNFRFHNGSQAELETTHHNPYTMELSRMPTVSQRMGDSKPVSRHTSLSGKHHYQEGNSNSQSYQQRTGIGRSNNNNNQSSSHQDIYGSSRFYKKPGREETFRERNDHNYDRDEDLDAKRDFDDKRNFYEKTPEKNYEKSHDKSDFKSDFKSEFKSFNRNYDYRNSSSNRFERSVNNQRSTAGHNSLHQVASAPVLTQSQINEKIRHEMEIGRKTNIQLNLLMNKTALWVNRQRFEGAFCDDLNDSYT